MQDAGGWNRFFLLRINFGELLELYLIAAILTVLGIRTFLAATGYPQLGGGGLHIAHMLWGGLGMLVGFILVVVSLSRWSLSLAALVSGMGFGAFIDEIGKFVTSDNDYFYQPAVAMIYVAFMLIYLLGRFLEKRLRPSGDAYLANAIELLKEAAVRDLDVDEKARARDYLSHVDAQHPLAAQVAGILDTVEAVPVKPPGRIARMGARLRAAYFRAAGSRWFTAVVVVVFVVGALVGFGQAIVAIGSASAFVMTLLVVLAMAAVLVSIRQWDTSATARWLTGTATIAAGIVALALVWIFERGGGVPQLTFAEWGTLISSLVAGLFVLFGIWRLRTSRVAAYEMFLRAVLVAIFFSQVFNFYRDARVALAGVIVDIIIYGVLRYMIAQEEAAAGANPAPPAAAGTGQ